MLIALDYDKTYTADVKLWATFIADARRKGHTVVIVTMRYPSESIDDAPCKVIYTSRLAKRKFVNADIWIDDSPQWIFEDVIC